MKKIVVFVFIFLSSLHAETIKVGLEPFPPLINEDGTGFTIEILNKIEEISNLDFDIQIMPYVRMKDMIRTGKLDLMAHTPNGLEEESFYEYAVEIDWSIDTGSDLYGLDPDDLHDLTGKKIGTPRGNKEFAAALLEISVDQFYDSGDLKSLLYMLKSKRIDLFWFERNATMTTILENDIKGIYYTLAPPMIIPAGFAVQNNKKGERLKTLLENYIDQIDTESILKEYYSKIKLPDSGLVE